MGKRGLVFALVLLALAGCKKTPQAPESSASPQIIPQPQSAPQPVQAPPASAAVAALPQLGWKQYDAENFSLAPSRGRVFLVPKNASQLRVQLAADSAILAGVMNKQKLDNKTASVRAANFLALPCAFVGSKSATRQCSLDPNTASVFILRDVRETGMGTVSAQNKIKIAISACMAGCKL